MDSSRIVDLEQTSEAQQRHLERLEGQVTTAILDARSAQDTAYKAHIKARGAAATAQWAASEAK
eukprot:11761158-Alexandrium_andersonii.AAC.1